MLIHGEKGHAAACGAKGGLVRRSPSPWGVTCRACLRILRDLMQALLPPEPEDDDPPLRCQCAFGHWAVKPGPICSKFVEGIYPDPPPWCGTCAHFKECHPPEATDAATEQRAD